MSNNQPKIEVQIDLSETKQLLPKKYEKPILTLLGDLRALTLGTSPVDLPDSDFNAFRL